MNISQIGDPFVTDLAISIAVLGIVGGLGVNILGQVVEESHKIEVEKCEERFGSDFSNGTMDGEYVCISNGTVYNPDVQALNSETNNPIADMVVIPFNFLVSLPWWIHIPLSVIVIIISFWAMMVVGPR